MWGCSPKKLPVHSSWYITVLLQSEDKREIVKSDDKMLPGNISVLTASFDHNIVDGAPGARFMNSYGAVKSGSFEHGTNNPLFLKQKIIYAKTVMII